jgi:hypothetical protein
MISYALARRFSPVLKLSDKALSVLYGRRHSYFMNMIEAILWTAIGFAPTLATLAAWNVVQKKVSQLNDQVVARVVN